MINRPVISKNVRILNIPSNDGLTLKELTKKFLKIVNIGQFWIGISNRSNKLSEAFLRYDIENDPNPLGWINSGGSNSEASGFKVLVEDAYGGSNPLTKLIKVEMSGFFWEHYLEKGKRHLYDHNRKHNSNVRLIRGQTIRVGDLKSLRKEKCRGGSLSKSSLLAQGDRNSKIEKSTNADRGVGRKREAHREESFLSKMSRCEVAVESQDE
ncbi:hypothetical protein COOONC_03270 [Cooperia oncophora]